MDSIPVFVGFDPREAVAYHTFCQSVIETSTVPVAFHPLHRGMLNDFDGQADGSNAFTLSRYLVPSLCNYEGWALFVDGDMAMTVDIAELWSLKREDCAVMVVKHDYKTRHKVKYIGSTLETVNVNYPRKNWASVVLWNCGHPANKRLTRNLVAESVPEYLHRFSWIPDSEIGSLPEDWNHLVNESAPASPALCHYTLGVPGLRYYADDSNSWKWHAALVRALQCGGEIPSVMVHRAEERVGAIH